MDTKKFLLILTDLNMGGVTTAAVNFCNGLVERGDSVDVLLMSDCAAEDEARFDSRVKFLHLMGTPKLWNLGSATIRQQTNFLKKALYCSLGLIKKLLNKKSLWNSVVFRKKILFSGYDVALAYRQCAPCYYFALNCVDAEKKVAFVHGDLRFMGDISTWQKYMECFDAVAYVSNAVKDIFVQAYPELRQML